MRKPDTAAGYRPEHLLAVRGACLDLFATIGEMVEDVVVVGGLVPSLLIDPVSTRGETHVGTVDLDLGLQVGLARNAHFRRLAARLRDRGFEPGRDESGEVTRHRWVSRPRGILVDFLTPQGPRRKGTLAAVDTDLEAFATPGLDLAFADRVWVEMNARPGGESGPRRIPVCGPAAFVILKALAFRSRRANKDAYDIDYLLRHYGDSVEAVATRMRPLQADAAASDALTCLREDFADLESRGPIAVAAFLGRSDDEGFRADVAGLVQRLIRGLAA
jgi:hypothetical protein